MTDESLLATFWLGDLWCGIEVARVQEVLRGQVLAPVPCAPLGVVGLLNLRGQVLAAIDVRERMGLPAVEAIDGGVHYIVSFEGSLASLIVDREGPVVAAGSVPLEPVPDTTPAAIAGTLLGAYQRDEGLLLAVSLDHILSATGQGVK